MRVSNVECDLGLLPQPWETWAPFGSLARVGSLPSPRPHLLGSPPGWRSMPREPSPLSPVAASRCRFPGEPQLVSSLLPPGLVSREGLWESTLSPSSGAWPFEGEGSKYFKGLGQPGGC